MLHIYPALQPRSSPSCGTNTWTSLDDFETLDINTAISIRQSRPIAYITPDVDVRFTGNAARPATIEARIENSLGNVLCAASSGADTGNGSLIVCRNDRGKQNPITDLLRSEE